MVEKAVFINFELDITRTGSLGLILIFHNYFL